MKILCVFGEHNYGDPARGHGYEYSNFLPALRNLGHEVDLFDSFSRSRYTNFAALNRALLKKVDDFRPDLVFCVLMGYEIWLETFALIRNSGIRLLNWGTDDSWKYEQFSRHVAFAFDVWVTTSFQALQKAQRDGLNHFVLSQWAARADYLREPLPASACRYPVSFVGSAYGNRSRWIAKLAASGIEVACFGHGWPAGPVAAQDIPRIVRDSVVSLNFADSGLHIQGLRPYRSRQIKARVFEVPGAGGCLLTEVTEYLDHYYIFGNEIEIFLDIDDLVKKIRHLIECADYRDTMAQAGYRRTLAWHTYEQRFNEVLQYLPQPQQVVSIDFAYFESIAARHRLNAASRLLRSLLLLPFQLIWG
ncbi:MAG: CgeB family protein, partial [Methylococcales bacterium]